MSNQLVNMKDLTSLAEARKSTLTQEIVQKLPVYLSLEKMGITAEQSESIGDSPAENALEAVMRFNDDMKLLSFISY